MIHPTAIVHPKAKIGNDCDIGPYSIIGEHVELGDGCRLHSHVVMDGHTVIGKGNEFFPFGSIGLKSQDLKWKAGNVTWTRIGDHNTFREGVTIHSATGDGESTIIGSNNLLLATTHVAHNCVMGNYIIMSNYAGLAGHVVVEDRAIIGGYVAVHQFCRVGTMSMTGGGSATRQDVPPYMIADGFPAETKAVNKVGLERNGVSEEAQRALKQAFKIIFRDGLATTNALEKIEAELPPLPEIQHLVKFIRSSERGVCR